ncbi:MAG: site-specific integrase [Nanoarchaeota archaeon]|nr:site-specific integrase [Nanoarchaeota archaeon]
MQAGMIMDYINLQEKIHVEFGEELQRLEREKRITKDTAKTYLSAAQNIFKYMDQNDKKSIEDIEQEDFEDFFIKIIKTKNKFSSHKSALKKLVRVCPTLQIPDDVFFESEAKNKTRAKIGGSSSEPVDVVKRKINGIRNEKLRIGYRLALATGLRVSEISKLTGSNIQKTQGADKLVIQVIEGKGRKNRTAVGLEDSYLVEKVKKLIQETPSGENLFYSKSFMMNEATRLGFECHDLRRIYAKELLQEKLNQGCKRWKSVNYVKIQLGHSKLRTTKIYLK